MFKTNDQKPTFRAAELAFHVASAASGIRDNGLTAYKAAKFVQSLQSLAAVAKRHETAMCSEPGYSDRWTDPETGEDKRAAYFEKNAAAALENLPEQIRDLFSIKVGGDPRGPCCTLHIKGRIGDGWSRDGFPVY